MNLIHLRALLASERIDPLIVCHIPNPLAALIGATRGRVLLSHDTVLKQLSHHGDLTIDDYRVLPACVTMGEYRQDTPRTVVINFVDEHLNGANYRAALKVPSDKPNRIYCVSFNRLRDRMLAKERRSKFPVIKAHD